jgi:hypothetical protein
LRLAPWKALGSGQVVFVETGEYLKCLQGVSHE